MKTTTITILLLVASLFAHGQINNNSTRTNSNGDVQLRRYSAGDTAWKRALVVGYNSSNSNGKLYLNYAGDFKDGLRIDGPHPRENLAEMFRLTGFYKENPVPTIRKDYPIVFNSMVNALQKVNDDWH